MNIKRTVVCGLAVAISCISLADRGFFSKEQSLYPPSIPKQRAIVSLRGGMEMMVVESQLSGQPGEYAWVVPLPNEPIQVEKADSSIYQTMSYRLNPKLETRPMYPVPVFWFGALTILLMTVSAFHRYRSDYFRASRYLCEVLGVICACFVLNALTGKFLPSMYGDAKEGTTAAGVSLYGRGSVGNYDYVVASASESDKLIDWLNENHYQVSEMATSTLQSYINKGWKFFVAKLKTEPGLNPHPVMLRFKSKNLVYPMALTATMPPPLNLDLFVVSDRIAFNKDTITYAADNIHTSYLINNNRYGRLLDGSGKTPAWQYDLFYPGCVISRLSGNFKDKIPANDMLFSYKRFSGLYQATLYSKDTAKQNAISYALLAFSILTVIVGAILVERKVSPYRVWAAALALALLSICFGYWRFAAVQLQPYDEDVYSRY